MVLSVCIFLLCFLPVLYKVTTLILNRRHVLRYTEAFPGPRPNFLFGNMLEFKQDGTDLNKLVDWGKQFPYAFPLWFGPSICFINTHHPDYVKTILTSKEPKDEFGYGFLEPWIGPGLLLSEGQKWFRHRRLLTPGFHYDVLKPYVKVMSESTHIMLEKWEEFSQTNKVFELFENISLMTLDTILKCAFSCKSNCQTESGSNSYIKAVFELSTLINLRIRMFPYHSDLIFYLSPHGFRFRKACRVAHRHTEEVIRKRKAALKEDSEFNHEQTKRYLDFLDILLSARDEKQQSLSVQDVQAEVDTFMFEGHDTISSGLSFLLYCLARHPEHQRKCRDEVRAVLQDKDSMDWEDLNKIPYTTMCIKESLRLYPPVPGMARKLTKPLTFCDGRTVPAGARVGTSVYALHRNSTVWKNPEVFDPLRFLPENVSQRSPHAFVPFSAGPRNCIGQSFAMNGMKVVVALTLKRYQLIEEPSYKPKIVPRLVLSSLNGIHIRIKPATSSNE